jgi:GxxExxY protein
MKPLSENFPHKEEGYAILGAVFEVYQEMGCGFLEVVYQECLERELRLRSIPFTAQATLNIPYKGENLRQAYQPDFICFDKIILELKAVTQLAPEHRAQMHNYLKATGMAVGYLINFGHYPKVEFERTVRTLDKSQNNKHHHEDPG